MQRAIITVTGPLLRASYAPHPTVVLRTTVGRGQLPDHELLAGVVLVVVLVAVVVHRAY